MPLRSLLLLLATVLGILGVWMLLSHGFEINAAFLPSPKATMMALVTKVKTAHFWLDVWTSWLRVLIGFALSFAVAYPATMAAMMSRSAKDVVFYIVEFFRYLPVPVFIPLTIFWFGVDDLSKVMIVFLGTFAQMIPMFYDSASLMDQKFDAFIHGLKWSRWRYVLRVVLPGSMPLVFDNARLCLGWAWTYLIIAELLGAENGLGFAIIRAQRYLATDEIFAYIITIGLLGILMDRLMRFLKKQLFQWQ